MLNDNHLKESLINPVRDAYPVETKINVDEKYINKAEIEPNIAYIYYWKPYWSPVTQNGTKQVNVYSPGHVSMQTREFYASLWPSETPHHKSAYIEMGILHESLMQDIVEEAKTPTRNTGQPDETIQILGLDINKMSKKFLEFQALVNQGKVEWSLLSNEFLINRCFSDKVKQNCSGLVAELLEAGGIRKLIPEFRSNIKDDFHIYHYRQIFVALGPANLVRTSAYSVIIITFCTGIPIMLAHKLFNRNKLYENDFNSDSFTQFFVTLSVLLSTTGVAFLIEPSMNKLDPSSAKGIFTALGVAAGVLLFVIPIANLMGRRVGRFIARCLFRGVDELIRPDGIARLAKYAAKLATVTPNVREKVRALQSQHYLPVQILGFVMLIANITKVLRDYYLPFYSLFYSYHLFSSLNEERQIGKQKDYYKIRFEQYDEKNYEHWPLSEGEIPSREKAKNDYYYFIDAMDNSSHSPGFFVISNLGLFLGMLFTSLSVSVEESSFYFPFICSGAALGGYVLFGLAFKLYKMLSDCKNRESLDFLKESEHHFTCLKIQRKGLTAQLLEIKKEISEIKVEQSKLKEMSEEIKAHLSKINHLTHSLNEITSANETVLESTVRQPNQEKFSLKGHTQNPLTFLPTSSPRLAQTSTLRKEEIEAKNRRCYCLIL